MTESKSRMANLRSHLCHLNIRACFGIRHSCFVIVLRLFITVYRLNLTRRFIASDGSNAFSLNQPKMDESGARLVHGGGERSPNLAAVLCCDWNQRASFRRIQSARVRYLSGHLSCNRGTGYEYIKIWREPSPTKTRPECSDGAVTKSPAKVS